MEYVICFNFHRLKCTLVCIDDQSFTDICALLFRTLSVSWLVYILQLSAIVPLKCKICGMHELQHVNTKQIMQHTAKDSFYLSVSISFTWYARLRRGFM